MKRKPALAIAATAAMVGAAGIVTVAALTGVNILGLHVGTARQAAAPVTTRSTEAPVADDSPPQTLAPAVVLQTEFVDQIVTISVPGAAAPVAAPAAYTPPAAQGPVAGSAPSPAAPAPAAAPVTTPAPVVTTPAPAAPAPTTPAPTAPPTTAPPTPAPTQPTTATTLFNKAAYPFKISIPADWGSKPVPAPPAPAAGRQWSECELHPQGWWECQYP